MRPRRPTGPRPAAVACVAAPRPTALDAAPHPDRAAPRAAALDAAPHPDRAAPRPTARPLRNRLALACALAAALSACAHRGYRSPEALREAYKQALARDDPKAAYALLAPEVQARIAPDQFRARWDAEKAERQAALAELDAVDASRAAPVRGGTTTHPNGATLEWAEVGGRYLVVSGLPGLPDTSTPAQAIRAFVAAVRGADLGALEALLSEELRARLAEDWESQVGAIEARLGEPGAIELSADNRQALLRYDGSRALVLEQTDDGWKITSLR